MNPIQGRVHFLFLTRYYTYNIFNNPALFVDILIHPKKGSDFELDTKDKDSAEESEDDLEFLQSDEEEKNADAIEKEEKPDVDSVPVTISDSEPESGDDDVDKKLKEKTEKVEKRSEKPDSKKIDKSDNESPSEKPKNQKSKNNDKLLTDKIDISSDEDFEKLIESSKVKKKSNKKTEKTPKEEISDKKKSSKKRKRVQILSDSENEFASEDEDSNKKKKRKKKKSGSGSEIEISDDSEKENKKDGKKKKGEKSKSRKIMTDEKLSEETRKAEADEKSRKERLEKIREERKGTGKKGLEFETKDWNGILNKEPLVEVDSDLRSNLKSHQIEGIEFMWDSTIESVKKDGEKVTLGTTPAGHGCILAHCMGLGKTLQSITLLHTLYIHEFIGLTKFVVLCPLNVCENWLLEVEKWTGDLGQPMDAWNLQR